MLLTIATKGEKGRAFSADMIAHATADVLWTDADKARRPLWAVFAGPSEQLRAFTENLRLGHAATLGTERGATRYEFMKSAPYRWWTRPLPAGGSVTTVAHPSLLSWRAPVEDAYRYRFLVLPARSWLAAQRFDLSGVRETLEALKVSATKDRIATDRVNRSYYADQDDYKSRLQIEAPAPHNIYKPVRPPESLSDLLGYGALLLHYLDHRLPLPVPRDPVFGLWMLLVGHHGEGPIRLAGRETHDDYHAKERIGYRVETPENAGCAPGFVFSPGIAAQFRHSDLDVIKFWLAREVQRWADVTGRV